MPQQSLFSANSKNKSPLAFKARPESFEQFHGQGHIFKRFSWLKSANFPSIILFGPPGCGKTTLAKILANDSGKKLFNFNAVLGGIPDLKKIIKSALDHKDEHQQEIILFIDEIHRFNKSQQDALLPYVETGAFTLIGATTEYPKTSINKALISRVKLVELKKLNDDDLCKILIRAAELQSKSIEPGLLKTLALYSDGDARNALNTLEVILSTDKEITKELIKSTINEQSRSYDKNGDRHYDVISAFIKSMRGSDPNAAVLWLAVMLDGGEDPVFIARRLVIFASEDIGNADPSALNLAVSCLTAVQQIGMPEARLNLAQTCIYLASTIKSNASYMAINEALEFVKNSSTIEVPSYLKSTGFNKKDYKYPHNFKNHYIDQSYSPNNIPIFYHPTEQGTEKKMKIYLDGLKKK